MGWKRIGLMRRSAAGGEARKRASFLLIESASYDTKTLHREDAYCAPEKMAANAAAFQHGNVPGNIFCADGNCRQHFWTGGRKQGYV